MLLLLLLLSLSLTSAEAPRDGIENTQRSEWLKHKGMDPFDAMQLYMDKVKELSQIYQVAGGEKREQDQDQQEEPAADGAETTK